MKLYGKLLVSMIAAGALALAVLALALNWRLGQGFVDFINATDVERLPAIAVALAEHYRANAGWHRLQRQPRRWRELLRRAHELDELQAEAQTPGLPTPQVPERWRRNSGPWAPLWARLSVYDAARRRVIGREDYGQGGQLIPIEVEGSTVGWVSLREVAEIRSPLAESFLADQRRGLLLASLAMMLILGVSAALLARMWTRPISRIGGVARRLAGGDFTARVGLAGRDEIGQLAHDIDFLARSLDETDAARKRWMADTAHELRTPLAVLKGELEALQDGIRPLDREAVASLHAEAEHLGALIEELRELALADVGALDYRMETLDLAELVRECLEVNAGRLRQHPLVVDMTLPSAPVLVCGDSRRLRQLVENLLENALRYTNPGGRLQVLLMSEHDTVVLRFDDSEPDVPADVLPTLFEPFVRVDAARTRTSGGSGLGLAICKRIVKAHGGRIAAEASPLGGLRVTIHLSTQAG